MKTKIKPPDTSADKIRAIQAVLGVVSDGIWGPKSQAALDDAKFTSLEGKEVNASSFADPQDVAAFLRCKAQGLSDHECFHVGDNGIGFTGLNCADENVPMCALPREEWGLKYGKKEVAGGKPVDVTHAGKTVRGILGDTMPALRNIMNGARIDLNPGFAKAFGLRPPFIVRASWKWVGLLLFLAGTLQAKEVDLSSGSGTFDAVGNPPNTPCGAGDGCTTSAGLRGVTFQFNTGVTVNLSGVVFSATNDYRFTVQPKKGDTLAPIPFACFGGGYLTITAIK